MKPLRRLPLVALFIVSAVGPGAAAPPRAETGTPLVSERTCGTPVPSEPERAVARERVGSLRATRPELAAGGTIGVAIHVITSGSRGSVSDVQIADQIRELNRDFAGTGFRFVLQSVDRTNQSGWFRMVPLSGSESRAKQALAVDPAHTLNLYTCSPGQGLLGWAYLPFSIAEDSYWHGVVVHYASLPGGALARFDLGRTAVHEVGHYLGLFHTFQGGCVEPGDEVDDTPFEASPAIGCPEGRNTCIQPGDDPIHNYMDYSDDACYTEFTADQADRMKALVAAFKPSLFERTAPLSIDAPRLDSGFEFGAHGPELALLGPAPHPIRDEAWMRFRLGEATPVSLALYSVTGSRVRELASGSFEPGEHAVRIDARGLAPGVYFVALRAGAASRTRSVVISP